MPSVHPTSAWMQNSGTILDDDAVPGLHGYEPQRWPPRWVTSKRNHKASSNQQEMFLEESNRTEPIFASSVPMRAPVLKKSRYHRYRKSTGMKAVGRSKAFSFTRRDQCQLLKEVWEDVDDSAISHRRYKRIWLVRPDTNPMRHNLPMSASTPRSNFTSSMPFLKEAGRKIRPRKVSWEEVRDRLQVFWKNMVRISWIRWFNEMQAMSWDVLYGDQDLVNYDQKPARCYNTGIGYKPQVREIAAHPISSRPRVEQFDEIPYRFQARQQPRRIRVSYIGTAVSSRGGQVIRPMHVSPLERGLCRSVAAGDEYES